MCDPISQAMDFFEEGSKTNSGDEVWGDFIYHIAYSVIWFIDISCSKKRSIRFRITWIELRNEAQYRSI